VNRAPQQSSQCLADIVRGLDPWHVRRLQEIVITTGDDGGWLAGLTFLRDIPSRADERPPHDIHPVHTIPALGPHDARRIVHRATRMAREPRR
jgi:hypothetical protein